MISLKPEQTANWIILTIGVKFDGAHPSFYKPPGAAFSDRYSIEQPEGDREPRIYIKPGDFPVYLALESEKRFAAFGFAKADRRWVRPRRHTSSGPCGGCFTLLILEPESKSDPEIILIQNDGYDEPSGYIWWLWTEEGKKRARIDPRIYNHGEIPPGGPPRGPGIFARLWRLLADLLKG